MSMQLSSAELLAFLLANLAVEQAALVTAVWQHEFMNGLESHRLDPEIVAILFPRASATELFNPELFVKGIEFRALLLSLIPKKSELLRKDFLDHLKRFIKIVVADTIQGDLAPSTS